jgi:integral membrane sensor domain MASE1
LLLGYRVSPAIFLGAFIANATTAGSIGTSLAIAAGNTLESLAGAYLLNKWSSGGNTFDTPVGVARFTLICLLVTMISPTLGVGSLSLAGHADWSEFQSIWATWWMGDLAGALVITPAIVLWGTRPVRWIELLGADTISFNLRGNGCSRAARVQPVARAESDPELTGVLGGAAFDVGRTAAQSA